MHVKWFTDSQAAAKIIEVGSMKLDLHMMARNIFSTCMQSAIHLEVEWIPRSVNQQADFVIISRLIDTEDWQITNAFYCFSRIFGGFSTYYNHKLPKFFSRSWNPSSAGVISSFNLFVEELPACSTRLYYSACYVMFNKRAGVFYRGIKPRGEAEWP